MFVFFFVECRPVICSFHDYFEFRRPCQLVSIIWRILEKTPAYASLQTLQTSITTPITIPTFPISATTLIIFGFLFINLFYKKNIFSRTTRRPFWKKHQPMQAPNASNASNASNHHSNFSNFRNYPNYFRFSIYKFILQKNIFSRTARRPFWKKHQPPTFPISATTLIIFGFLFINLFYKKKYFFPFNASNDLTLYNIFISPNQTR